MDSLNLILQIILVIGLAPLMSGVITWIKNNLRLRKGPGIFQPYFNLAKYFAKNEVVSKHASWIFRAAPYIVLASTVTAACLLPAFFRLSLTQYVGDFIAVIFLLSLGRFFLSLAGLDPASAFGGMGSSREMFISSFVEPVILLAVFGVSLSLGTTNLLAVSGPRAMTISAAIAVIALFIATLAETARLPVDNQETHLELTMVHEAMVLEYSGRSLALLELSAYVKQMIFFTLIANLVFTGLSLSPAFYLIKIFGIAIMVALVELSITKMRLFRVVDLLAFAAILSFLSVVGLVLGI
ncbi:MAG: NADH-quinone oxidoreductase subunit H [Candidatus Margulisbacteria bacterium]|nr:NADH-quinone oxidoreductase subunit H [Candidatus Margulisiibacteriota bacterium]